MPVTITAGVSAAAYGEDPEALDAWEDIGIAVEYDGDDTVILDAYPADADPADYALGRPGVGIRLTPAQADDLALALLGQAHGPLANELWHALDRAGQDLRYAADNGNYTTEDMPEIEEQLERYSVLMARILPTQELPL